ncbi:antibiotic biosynthesis monooxygenase family protein [Fodinicola acaciae]|uniref:antibiotic biosynthesis monooxygenase family protein n=1 Tax=Fodinicola acaciae TaxID=2681555 RepID=UPI0013D7F77B|nr:antibiotic biosynthesis monooxygenase family protein [Fodinicola acaciae]
MITLDGFDGALPLPAQLDALDIDQLGGAVTVVNVFVAPEGKKEEVVAAWTLDAKIMQAQQGYVRAQLYSAPGDSPVLVNVAVWESAAALATAINNIEFRQTLARYPDGTISHPQMVQPVAIPGVCGT